MKKFGPCRHCGVTSTPLWRNGPNEKSVLCNACAAHLKAKGTLENYLPKIVQQAQLLERNIQETCEHNVQLNIDEAAPKKDLELSNSSSSGVINTNLGNTEIPERKLTPIEEFQIELLHIYESEKQSMESSPDNTLLYDNLNNFIPSNEIGLGCTLLNTNATSTNQNHSHG